MTENKGDKILGCTKRNISLGKIEEKIVQPKKV